MCVQTPRSVHKLRKRPRGTHSQRRGKHDHGKKNAECTCAPCKAFWRKAFRSGAESIIRNPHERAASSSFVNNPKELVQKGDRVIVDGKHTGVVQYVGLPDEHMIAPELHVGVYLYENVYSTDNGTYNGKRYFYCPRGHGAMVKLSQIERLNPVLRTRDVNGNSMFPSYEAVKKRRREREKKIRESEEKLIQEHEIRRRAQLERFAKSAPPPRISPRPTKASILRTVTDDVRPYQVVQDDDDIAYKDYIYREKLREQNKPLDPAALEALQFSQTKKSFGGDERAERMATTFFKLRKGYEEGRIIVLSERE